MTAMRFGSAPPRDFNQSTDSGKVLHRVFAFLNIVEMRIGLPITCGAAHIGDQDGVTPAQKVLIDCIECRQCLTFRAAMHANDHRK